MDGQPRTRRLQAIERGVSSGVLTPAPAGAGAWLRALRELLGLGGANGEDAVVESATADSAGETTQHLPDIVGVVRGCYYRASDEERAATGWDASTGRFARERVQSITVTTDPNDPGLHPYAAGGDGSGAPPERGILCQTAEAYAKLREGLPESAALLSEDRPGSAENIFVDGLTAWELCVGDTFTVVASDGGSERVTLQVTSPRRPCEQWNQVHATEAFLQGTALVGSPPQRLHLDSGMPVDETTGNVRHFCLTNTLGGFFFRVMRGGEISVGSSLVHSNRSTCSPTQRRRWFACWVYLAPIYLPWL